MPEFVYDIPTNVLAAYFAIVAGPCVSEQNAMLFLNTR
jgi:hypothetical protein